MPTPLPSTVDPHWQRRRWERGTRYYEAHLHQDLWGEWILTRVWGRRGAAQGRVVHRPCASYVEALRDYQLVMVQRGRRGYRVME